jgi:hypothetical protein
VGTRWRWVVSFTPRPLHPQGKSLRYPLARVRAPDTHWIGGWVGPRAVMDTVVKWKIPSPRREANPRIPIFQPVAQRFTDWTKAKSPCLIKHHSMKTWSGGSAPCILILSSRCRWVVSVPQPLYPSDRLGGLGQEFFSLRHRVLTASGWGRSFVTSPAHVTGDRSFETCGTWIFVYVCVCLRLYEGVSKSFRTESITI